MTEKKYSKIVELKVLGSEIDVRQTESISWKGEIFPTHFQVSLMLEDRKPNTQLNWVASFEVIFREGEPFFKSVTCTGLGHQNLYFAPSIEESSNSRLVVSFTSPLETRDRTEVEQVQRWQLNYLQKEIFTLKRVCFELVARNTTTYEKGFVFSSGTQWNKDFGKGHNLEEFAKAFDEWQGRTLIKGSLLREVADLYLDEVLEAEREKRKAKPVQYIAKMYDKPVHTVNRWIAKARKEGLLPLAQKGKATTDFPFNSEEGEK